MKLKEPVIENNDFSSMLTQFERSEQSVWHVNRHALDSFSSISKETLKYNYDSTLFSTTLAGLNSGLGLLRYWEESRRTYQGSLFISSPVLVCGYEWYNKEVNAAPPYVNLCISSNSTDYVPLEYGTTSQSVDIFIALFSMIDFTGIDVGRLKSDCVDEEAGWIFECHELKKDEDDR